jgi:hypothetical protein
MSNEIVTFYNYEGRAVAYLYDGEYIYLYDGTPVAWLSDGEFIYSYSGKYLGWIQDGWIRDRNGDAVFFTEGTSGGHIKPARHARPARGARGARPARGAREARPARPARTLSWSRLSSESFFMQG